MTELFQAANQFATRPSDERFTSLDSMLAFKRLATVNSKAVVVPSKALSAAPANDSPTAPLLISGSNGVGYAPSHWAFGQLAQLAGAPAGYLRTLPTPIIADAMNWGLKFNRQQEEVGVLMQREVTQDGVVMIEGNTPATPRIVAATGPKYGRIWDRDVLSAVVDRFGNGVDGDFRVPGIFGTALTEVTKANTTLFAGDRDMFIFLADEEHRIDVPNRRNGETGSLARGFFIWNSEVGSKTFGIGTFLFDYVCCNRIVWGAAEYKEIKIRHSSLAPDRFLSEIAPALATYATSSTASISEAVAAAQAAKIDTDVSEFLAKRFGKGVAASMQTAHLLEEGRPIETLFDAVTGATAVARSIAWQDERVDLERKAGELMAMAA